MDVDPTVPARAGWAIVFPDGAPSEVRTALEPLQAHRRGRVPPDRCKVLDYRSGETMKDWLRRHGVYPGSVVPTKVPYYVMLVGDPTAIPLDFQYLLDIEYAVGRIAFDRPDQYRQYVESLVDYETAANVPNGRDIVYWGPRHAADEATHMSADCLLTPLSQGIPAARNQPEEPPISAVLSYRSRCFKGADANKATLAEVLHGRGSAVPPAMLFTASHGVPWPTGHERQRSAQGALLCQDWSRFGTISPDHYLTAGDVADDARLHGLVAFLFACYGAGTPAFDNFLGKRSSGPSRIAEQSFIAALPQRLLAHPQGGALAVIGHIDRAWSYSIRPPGVGPQLTPFRNCIGRILKGEPVGHTTKDFAEKYAAVSAELLNRLDDTQGAVRPSDEELARLWIERNDAQNYIVLGDPAVQVRADLLK
jgi:hypothetical protein